MTGRRLSRGFPIVFRIGQTCLEVLVVWSPTAGASPVGLTKTLGLCYALKRLLPTSSGASLSMWIKSMWRQYYLFDNMVASRNCCCSAWDSVPAVTWSEPFQPCNVFSKTLTIFTSLYSLPPRELSLILGTRYILRC